jgi:hypothetical protein
MPVVTVENVSFCTGRKTKQVNLLARIEINRLNLQDRPWHFCSVIAI